MNRPNISGLDWDPELSDLAASTAQKLEGPAPVTAAGVYREPEYSKQRGYFVVVDFEGDRRSAFVAEEALEARKILGRVDTLRTMLKLSWPEPAPASVREGIAPPETRDN
jgi:hypothetical protein